jgi:periplasmic protein CpxP/Spy
MKKSIAIAAGALLAVVGFVSLTGFGHWHGHPRDPAEVAAFVTARVDDVLDDLNATPDQRTRINAVKDRLLTAAQKAHGDHGAVHDAVLGEWKSASPDAQKLHAIVDERADAMKAFAHQAVDAGVEIHSILTPDQRERLTKKIERWHR